MDKKILDKIKETLDSSYEIQKDIKENEEKINKQEEDYNVEKESFDKEFQKENHNNPVYMDRRNSQMTELEKLNKELQDGKKLVEVKKVELKEKFNKNKEEILKQVEDRREKMKKNYEDYKTGLINEKKEDISRKIEILKKDMENKSAVALDIMKPMLQQREEKLKQINDEIANVENPEFEKEFEELSNVEKVLKQPYTTNFLIEGLAEFFKPYAAKMKEEKEAEEKEKEVKLEEEKEVKQEEPEQNEIQAKQPEEPKQNEVKANEPEEIKTKEEKNSDNRSENIKLNQIKQDDEEEKIHSKYSRMNDLKFERRHNEEANELDKITNVDVKINKKGILEYLIYEEGKKEPTIFSYNSNKFSLSDYKPILKNIRSHIDERQGFEILNEQDRKNIDPFLVDVIGEKIGSNKNSDSLDKLIVGGLYNNDYIDVKYDMENLKKVKGLRNKMHLREIARGAEKQGFEVENFKDTLLRRIISKIKNRSYELETKEEPKRIADGNKEEKIILRPKTSKEKNNDLSMDNKIRPNMHLHGKLKDKISDYRNNWLLKRSETFKKKSEKYDDMHKKTQDKIFDIINKENKEQEQNQSMKFDKFGNRVTKTPEEIKAEKRAKDISEKALKSIHEQQREEVK